MNRVCNDIQRGVVKRRGFSGFSEWLGNIQGKPWQGDSRSADVEIPVKSTIEQKARSGVKVHSHCTGCCLCVKICPMKNLVCKERLVEPLDNCTVCYRCVNQCPKCAITVMFHRIPKLQYGGECDSLEPVFNKLALA